MQPQRGQMVTVFLETVNVLEQNKEVQMCNILELIHFVNSFYYVFGHIFALLVSLLREICLSTLAGYLEGLRS